MKYILLLLSVVSLAYCATSCSNTTPSTSLGCLTASKADDCYCCYLKAISYTGGSVQKCMEVYKSSIDNDNVYNYIKLISIGYKNVESLYCKSSYLAVGLLSLVLLLF